jgi:hypothetical protein
LACVIQDAEMAREVFCRHFGNSRPIFVPPFNRISYSMTRALPSIGFVAISAVPSSLDTALLHLKSRFAWSSVLRLPRLSAIPRIDVHIDLIDWTSRAALDAGAIAGALVQQLRGRRTEGARVASPIGLLTHHLVHDGSIWRACDRLLDVLRQHKAVEFIDLTAWSERSPQWGQQKQAVPQLW